MTFCANAMNYNAKWQIKDEFHCEWAEFNCKAMGKLFCKQEVNIMQET